MQSGILIWSCSLNELTERCSAVSLMNWASVCGSDRTRRWREVGRDEGRIEGEETWEEGKRVGGNWGKGV